MGIIYLAVHVRGKEYVHNINHKTTDVGALEADKCCGTDDGQQCEKG